MSNIIYKEFDYPGNGDEIARMFWGEPYCFYLNSSQYNELRGRYSFIGFDPFEVVESKGENCSKELRSVFKQFVSPESCPATPLAAGMVGVLNYDYGFPVQKVKKKSKDNLNLPDCVFGLYDRIITIDHQEKKLVITSTGLPEDSQTKKDLRAKRRLDHAVEKIAPLLGVPEKDKNNEESADDVTLEFYSNFTREQYLTAVQKALDYIGCGDIYQVNLSQCFTYSLPERIQGLAIYQTLKELSSSSYGGYFNAGNFEIISSSPEQFLKLEDGVLTTRPMKGTRPRGESVEEDELLRVKY